jgi:arylformamidase
MYMPRYFVFSITGILLMAMASVAAEARLDRGCRMNRSAMRTCIRENVARFSEDCTAQLHEMVRDRGGRKPAGTRSAPAHVSDGEVIAYGGDDLQKLRFHRSTKPDAPLIIFVHGGGWKRGDMDNATGAYKVSHYLSRGFAFATINYRLVPQARVEEQAADIAAATAALRDRAQALGFDPDRIFLMGHSAGAHLAALVATDLSYFRQAGVNPAALRGAVLLDGAAYDVPEQLLTGNRFMQKTYVQAFGSDPERQQRLSPVYHAAAPNAPAFLILHVERKDAKQQSEKLAENLVASGSKAQVAAIPGKGLSGHMEINQQLGEPDYPATSIVDDWLADRLR